MVMRQAMFPPAACAVMSAVAVVIVVVSTCDHGNAVRFTSTGFESVFQYVARPQPPKSPNISYLMFFGLNWAILNLLPELLVVSFDPKMPCIPLMAKPATRTTNTANVRTQNLLSSRRLLETPTIVALIDSLHVPGRHPCRPGRYLQPKTRHR